jgi:FAD/FMN-containing dehydrogenase
MSEIRIRTLDGGAVAVAIESLRGTLRGEVCKPGEPGYDAARRIWNAMVDRRPAVVVRAAVDRDVVETVRFAAKHQLVIAIRAGGHNIAGNAVCDGGLQLDLSSMRDVRVDPVKRRAHVEAGAVLGDVDRATQAHGLVAPLGINSTTGVAGLTLGGGFGWTSRRFGLTIDNLVSADVVLADGELVRASESENPDLFWAIRGGGGNFGIVTSFEFDLHPVGPEVLSGLIVHPFAGARDLLRAYRRAVLAAPDELTCWAVLRKAPPLPCLPAEVHGTEVVVLAMCWAGDRAEGEAALAPIRALGKPIADVVGPHPYIGWQSGFDPLLEPGARNYWKSHDFTTLSDGAIDLLVDATGRLPSPECEIFVAHLGGAVNRVAANATAYPHRDVEFVVNVHGRWREASQDRACMDWARGVFDALAPHASGGVYVNFMPEDEAQRVQTGAYGANWKRLSELKARFDPQNLFRMNQNVAPAR